MPKPQVTHTAIVSSFNSDSLYIPALFLNLLQYLIVVPLKSFFRVSSRTMDEESSTILLGGITRAGIVAANSIFSIFATIAVGLRIVARRRERLVLEKDDYFIVIALVSHLSEDVLCSIGAQATDGRT